MMRKLNLVFMIAATVLSASLAVQAGEGAGRREGPIGKILENAKELGLTDEQKKKLEVLQKEVGAGMEKMREAAMKDPALREELKEARGNPEKMKEVMVKMREKSGTPGEGKEGKRGEMIKKVAEILTPDQMQKVKTMMEQGKGERRGGLGAGGKQEKGGEPDRNSAPPKVFE